MKAPIFMRAFRGDHLLVRAWRPIVRACRNVRRLFRSGAIGCSSWSRTATPRPIPRLAPSWSCRPRSLAMVGASAGGSSRPSESTRGSIAASWSIWRAPSSRGMNTFGRTPSTARGSTPALPLTGPSSKNASARRSSASDCASSALPVLPVGPVRRAPDRLSRCARPVGRAIAWAVFGTAAVWE